MADWELLGIILGIIVSIGIIYLSLYKIIINIIEYKRRISFNRKICDPLVESRNEFLEENYGIDPYKEFKNIKVEKNSSNTTDKNEREDFTAVLFPSIFYQDLENLNLDAIAIIIDLGIKKPIRDKLMRKGLEYEEADEIANENSKEILESTAKIIIKRRKSIEELKSKISQDENITIKRRFIKRNYDTIKKIIREKYHNNLKENFEKYLHSNKEYKELIKEDVSEIIKTIRTRREIKEELDVRGIKDQSFSRASIDKLLALKNSFLTNIKRVNEIGNRSEEIYAIILENPGMYETEMKTRFGVPQPTISIYCEEMAKNNLVIKDRYSTIGNILFLYPKLSSEEINKHKESLEGYEIGVITRIVKKGNDIILEEYENFKINTNIIQLDASKYIGYKVFLKVKVENASMIILAFGVVETTQQSLKEFLNK